MLLSLLRCLFSRVSLHWLLLMVVLVQASGDWQSRCTFYTSMVFNFRRLRASLRRLRCLLAHWSLKTGVGGSCSYCWDIECLLGMTRLVGFHVALCLLDVAVWGRPWVSIRRCCHLLQCSRVVWLIEAWGTPLMPMHLRKLAKFIRAYVTATPPVPVSWCNERSPATRWRPLSHLLSII